MKTIRREVIITEKDLVKIMTKSARSGLWDRIDSEPLTYQGIQNEVLIIKLKNPDAHVPHWSPLDVRDTLPNLYSAMRYKETELYNKKYLDWTLTMDYPAGQIYAQSRINQAKEPMVKAVLEKDIA